MFTTLIFFGFIILPWALSNYSKIEGKRLIKVLNLVITFFLLNVTSWVLRGNLLFLRVNFGNLIETEFVQIGIIPPLVNYVNFFLHIILMIAFSSVIIGLAVRNTKAYSLMKLIIPWICLSDAIVTHSKNFELYNIMMNYSDMLTFGYALLMKVLTFGGIFFIYHLEGFRGFFQNQKATSI